MIKMVLYKAQADDEIEYNKGHINERKYIVEDWTKNRSSESGRSCVSLNALWSNGFNEFLRQRSLVMEENNYVEEND